MLVASKRQGRRGDWVAANEPQDAKGGHANAAIGTRGLARGVRCSRARTVNRRRAGAGLGRVVALVEARVTANSARAHLPATVRRPAAGPAARWPGLAARAIPAGADPRLSSRRRTDPWRRSRSRTKPKLRPAQQHLRPTRAPAGDGDAG